MRKFGAICLCLMIVVSCIKDGTKTDCSSCSTQDVRFEIASENTKSVYSGTEDEISSLCIMVFSGNYMVSHRSFEGDPRGRQISMELPNGIYECFALANFPDFDPSLYSDKSGLISAMAETDMNSFNRYGFPMSWNSDLEVNHETEICTIRLERLVSRWELAVDLSAVPCLELNSVRVCNAAREIYPFSEKPSQSTAEGDSSSLNDIRNLNNGESAVLYIPENMQGTLLPGNQDPYLKNYEKLKENVGDAKAKLCTYIEIGAQFFSSGEDEPPYGGSLLYRFYLGMDETGNFDIERNSHHEITFIPTAGSPEGVRPDGGDIVWKVEPEIIKYEYSTEYSLTLSKSLLTEDGEKFTCAVTGQRIRNGAAYSTPWDATEEFSYASSNASITMNGVTGTLHASQGSQGNATITATKISAPDQGSECSAVINWKLEASHEPYYVMTNSYADDIPASGGSERAYFMFQEYSWDSEKGTFVKDGGTFTVKTASIVTAGNLGTTQTARKYVGRSILSASQSPDGKEHVMDIYQQANKYSDGPVSWGDKTYTGSISANPDHYPGSGGSGTLTVNLTYTQSGTRTRTWTSGATEVIGISQNGTVPASEYRIDSSQSWCAVIGTSINVAENTSSSTRTASISLVIDDLTVDSCTISQDKASSTIEYYIETDGPVGGRGPVDGTFTAKIMQVKIVNGVRQTPTAISIPANTTIEWNTGNNSVFLSGQTGSSAATGYVGAVGDNAGSTWVSAKVSIQGSTTEYTGSISWDQIFKYTYSLQLSETKFNIYDNGSQSFTGKIMRHGPDGEEGDITAAISGRSVSATPNVHVSVQWNSSSEIQGIVKAPTNNTETVTIRATGIDGTNGNVVDVSETITLIKR